MVVGSNGDGGDEDEDDARFDEDEDDTRKERSFFVQLGSKHYFIEPAFLLSFKKGTQSSWDRPAIEEESSS